MGSSTAPGSHRLGDRSDQYAEDPAWRLRDPGTGAVPRGERAAALIGPAPGRHQPRSGRPGVRREYYHQPDAPAATCVAPCACAAVRDVPGRLLLVRRCDTGDWELPGGRRQGGAVAPLAAPY